MKLLKKLACFFGSHGIHYELVPVTRNNDLLRTMVLCDNCKILIGYAVNIKKEE